MNQTSRFLRKYAASTLLVAFCLYHNLSTVRGLGRDHLNSASPDPVTVFEKRLEPVRVQLVRQGYTKVGYITDMPEVADWFTEYFQTQYVLAPIIVDSTPDCPIEVANLHDPSSIKHIIEERQLIPVEDYGKGVLLLSKEAH